MRHTTAACNRSVVRGTDSGRTLRSGEPKAQGCGCARGTGAENRRTRRSAGRAWSAAERLFVGSLPLYAESHEVADLFRPYGEVRKASVIFDGNGRSRGFGFVLFSSSSDTLSVLEHHGRVGFTMGLMRDGTPHKLEVRREKKRSEAQRPEGAPMGDGSGGKKKRKNRPCGKKRRAAFLEQQAAATSAAAAAAASPLKTKKTSMRKSKSDAEKAPKSPKEDATKSTEPKSGKASKLRGVTSGRIAKPNNKAAAA